MEMPGTIRSSLLEESNTLCCSVIQGESSGSAPVERCYCISISMLFRSIGLVLPTRLRCLLMSSGKLELPGVHRACRELERLNMRVKQRHEASIVSRTTFVDENEIFDPSI